MFGLLCLYDDGNVSLTITPDPDSDVHLRLTVTIHGLVLPAMAIPIHGLRELFEKMVNDG